MGATAATIEAFLALIQGLIPSLGTATTVIDEILTALVTLVPIIAANATNFLTPVKNIIAALQASGAVTPAQMTTLQQLDAQCDAAFDAAASAAGV